MNPGRRVFAVKTQYRFTGSTVVEAERVGAARLPPMSASPGRGVDPRLGVDQESTGRGHCLAGGEGPRSTG